MDAITQQLPALLGVLVGAFSATGGAVLAERVRWRRDYARRWDANRLAVVVAYARAVKVETRLCLRVAGSRWPGTSSNPLTAADAINAIGAAEDERSAAFEPLLLLVDPNTVRAAREWQEAAWALHVVLDVNADSGRDDFLELFRRAGIARDEFYRAARRTLDVPGPQHSNTPTTWQGLESADL